MVLRFIFPPMRRPARASGRRFSRPGVNSKSCPAAWARATRCGWRLPCRSMATRSTEETNVFEAGLERFCKLDKPDFLGQAGAGRAFSESRRPTAQAGRPGNDRARHRPRRLSHLHPDRRTDWRRHQRLACAISQEEHCARPMFRLHHSASIPSWPSRCAVRHVRARIVRSRFTAVRKKHA